MTDETEVKVTMPYTGEEFTGKVKESMARQEMKDSFANAEMACRQMLRTLPAMTAFEKVVVAVLFLDSTCRSIEEQMDVHKMDSLLLIVDRLKKDWGIQTDA